MATYPPFMNSTGLISKILDRMIEAQRPDRFTQDFLSTKLGYGSGSARPIVPLLKRIGFLRSDGTPTDLYTRFRNPGEQGRAMAEALRAGYREVFERNEYAYDLPRDKFKDLVVEITGLEKTNTSVKAIVGTFFALKKYANFEVPSDKVSMADSDTTKTVDEEPASAIPPTLRRAKDGNGKVGLNLSYTINLNLPETTDVEVFNAIFRSLKENILKG